MNQDELELARSAMETLQCMAGNGYEILVRGTVIENVLSIAVIAIWMITVVCVIKYTYKKFNIEEKDSDAFAGWIVTMVVFGFLFGILIELTRECVIGIFMPDYVVINKVITAAVAGGT
jgi:hypothetical protein